MNTLRFKVISVGIIVSLLTIINLPTLGMSIPHEELFLNRLEGTWKGEGKAFGMEARFYMQWEWILANQFARLTYRIDMNGTDGKKHFFEGHAYYKPLEGGQYHGTWFDSQSEVHPIKANADGVALTAFWGSPETKEGKSIYRLINNRKLELIDFIKKKDGSWKEFNRTILTLE